MIVQDRIPLGQEYLLSTDKKHSWKIFFFNSQAIADVLYKKKVSHFKK